MLLLEAGGLAALLRLAHPDARSPEARTHARHALRRLADQPLVSHSGPPTCTPLRQPARWALSCSCTLSSIMLCSLLAGGPRCTRVCC